jgi:hypothetical protein
MVQQQRATIPRAPCASKIGSRGGQNRAIRTNLAHGAKLVT